MPGNQNLPKTVLQSIVAKSINWDNPESISPLPEELPLNFRLHFPELHNSDPQIDWNNKINDPNPVKCLNMRSAYRNNFLRNAQLPAYDVMKQDPCMTDNDKHSIDIKVTFEDYTNNPESVLGINGITTLPNLSFPPREKSFTAQELQSLINLNIPFEVQHS